jgi:hypothetical protein
MLHHVKPVRQRCGEAEILLHHHNGVALFPKCANHARERLHNHRGQALGYLVKQQQSCAGPKDAGHGQHLLLSARKPCALARPAFGEIGKHLVDFRD